MVPGMQPRTGRRFPLSRVSAFNRIPVRGERAQVPQMTTAAILFLACMGIYVVAGLLAIATTLFSHYEGGDK